jgi:alpha-glucosidase
MWARDIPTPIENGKTPGNNLYGVHPFYMYKLEASRWMGVFTNLVQAQDWYIKNDQGNGQVDIQSFATGGVADIYVMLASTPDAVTASYFKIVGSPVIIPQWALGWNQCRYGYNNTAELNTVLKGYQSNGLPLDVMWSDIDYLQSYQDFTYDKADYRYKDLPQFINNLTNMSLHYVPILDAGISLRPNQGYKAYDEGKKDDVFMKIRLGEDLVGQVWPKDAVYPDWVN